MSISVSTVSKAITNDCSDPIWEGYLLKQGGTRGGFRNWKKRWFCLDMESLCYYKQRPNTLPGEVKGSTNTSEPMLGSFPIRNATAIDIQSPDDLAVNASESPPNWDVGAVICSECKLDLIPARRKRFCRGCGKAFCSACSPRTIILSKTGFVDPVRVCTACFNGMTSVGSSQPKISEYSDDNIITKVIEQKKGFEWRAKKNTFILNSTELQVLFQAETPTIKLDFLTAIRSVVIYHRNAEMISTPEPHGSPTERNATEKHKLDRQASAPTSQWTVDFKAIKILHEVGDGTSGVVYKGRLWGTDVAIKTISDASMVAELQKEVEIVSQLRHPNVILYIGACLEPPNIAVVTEWCDRGSLFTLLYDESPDSFNLDFQTSIAIAIGIAQGMNYLHSLNQKIIHRDLKSQNILIDSHFTPKVADFGLSKMKHTTPFGSRNGLEASTESLPSSHQLSLRAQQDKWRSKNSSQYNLTAEWMAPEVMEGVQYNQSVDIYSYGIVMSELFSRQLPFRDKYVIRNHADVKEAVLEEGAIPTIPDWAGSKMKKIVSDCLNRNADARPSFNEIILRLRSFYPLESADVFQKFDAPRLLFMLDSSDRSQLFRAVRELADMSHDLSETCHACGHTPFMHSFTDDSTLIQFVFRLSYLLQTEHGDILLNTMRALGAIIDFSDAPLRSKLIAIIRQDIGIQRISAFNEESELSKSAAELLSRIIADPGSEVVNSDTLYGASNFILEGLLSIAEQEARHLEEQIKENDTSLSKKMSLASWISNRIRQSEAATANTLNPLQTVLAPRTIVMNSPERSLTKRKVLSFENKGLPDQLQAELGPGAQCWGWLGLLDPAGEQWIDVYGVLSNAAIHIFDSEESKPDAARLTIRIRVGSVCAKFRAGRKRGRQNCLQIALSSEVLPVTTDPNLPQMRRVFINLGSPERFSFWVKHINEHLDIPIAVPQDGDAVEDGR